LRSFIQKQRVMRLPPAVIITGSFLLVILAGTFLLCLPFAAKDGTPTPLIDSLFTATSATCVTGLVVYDTFSHWSVFGQVVILLLIQIGGIGLVTFGVFFSILLKHKIGLKNLVLAQESTNNYGLTDTLRLVSLVVRVSLLTELAGALILMLRFIPHYGAEGIYISVFMSVSAFCNAGFDVLGREGPYSSLIHYNSDPVVLLTIMSLIVIGGLGFVVWRDIGDFRKNKKLLLHTKIVLVVSAILIALGTAAILMLEWGNPKTLETLPWGQKLLASLFQSVTPRTAGFNTLDINAMTSLTKLLLVVLMFIGAAPGSTGGGIKVTTFTVAMMTVLSVIRGREETVLLKRKIPMNIVYKAIAIIALSLAVIAVTAGIIWFTEPDSGLKTEINSLFEATSAFGTVGLSAGLTPGLHTPSKIALILTMFFGRIGPMTLATALTISHANRKGGQIIPEGRVIVG